eukprot:10357300-Alexandrium_andersonii.AAC.1
MQRDLPTVLSRMLMFCVQLHKFITLDPIFEVLTWSFECALNGFMPALNHEGANRCPVSCVDTLAVAGGGILQGPGAISWSQLFCLASASQTAPAMNCKGQPFPAGSLRHRMSGERVAGKYRFLLCQMVGDWKFIREVLALREHYNATNICW